MRIKPLEWSATPPEGMEGDPKSLYAVGLGGHYCADHDGLLWWAHEPFIHQQFNDRKEAQTAAQIDHEDRVSQLIV